MSPRIWQRLAQLYRVYYRTLRLRGENEDGKRFDPRAFAFSGEIFALCERDTLALAGLAAMQGFTALVALGVDGDRAAAALQALGCRVVRGSSRRGGWSALRGLLAQVADSPGPLAVVVDGPLGPAGRVRPGALVCSRESGRAVRPVVAQARHRLRFPRTWSGIYFPLPFTRVEIAFGVPLWVPAAAGTGEIDRLAGEIEHRLAAARERAARSGRAA